LHAFVVMPNHIHLLITVPEGMTLERVMQLIKGGFSYQTGKLFGLRSAIWQKSFVDRRVRDLGEYERFRDYIHQNPVRAGLVATSAEYLYSSANPAFHVDELPQRLKRLLKKSKKQIPRGLKSARDDKNKELATAQLKLCPFKAALSRLFQRPVKPDSLVSA
jgi:hypothetical protein